ncbi:hypothetical protein IQ254_09435 [Nodosilinea sp. LEGE 07088]|nr:hypothetical protein [Nodosilinea sp. LEGE 07088]MBE9137429.1 hypothetical protein [Nodosilinea sp. LEGE 07088]
MPKIKGKQPFGAVNLNDQADEAVGDAHTRMTQQGQDLVEELEFVRIN